MKIKTPVKDLIQFTIAATLITATLVGCGAAAAPKKRAHVSEILITEVNAPKAAAPEADAAEYTVEALKAE